MSIVLNGTTGITTPDVTSDSYTGPLSVDASAPDDSLVVDASGNVGIGASLPTNKLTVNESVVGVSTPIRVTNTSATTNGRGAGLEFYGASNTFGRIEGFWAGTDQQVRLSSTGATTFSTNDTERARIDSAGSLLVGTTSQFSVNSSTASASFFTASGIAAHYVAGDTPLYIGRQSNDGTLISLRQAGVQEGTISVSGTTVSYNGGHLARWAQTTIAKDESLVKGTVLSNLDDMNVYVDADGNPVDNEQLNKVKVSDVEGDTNVAGVFVNWDYDEDHNVDEINMAMTGDMIIRIAAGTTVARGDLLMSAGDGTAKPQGDDIVRSKTIAKVTSTNITCTYADGSFCVPCVLMAC
jgi:hypothetical protein